MNLTIENVGKILKTTTPINFNGITVLAGKNDTGKSTVSKILYCIFSSLFNIDDKILTKRRDDILDSINTWDWISLDSPLIDSILICDDKKKISKILQDYYISILEDEYVVDEGINFGKKSEPNMNAIKRKSDEETEIIYGIKLKKKDYFLYSIVENKFLSEFVNQINSLYNDDDCKISLNLKNSLYKFCFKNNKLVDLQLPQEKIKHKIMYFDGPQLIDGLRRNINNKYGTHKTDYYFKVFSKNNYNNVKYNKIIEKYYSIFSNLIKYKFITNEFNRLASVNLEGTSKLLSASLLSNGSKVMALLHNLFLTDFLSDENLLILDEPEVNLHPEWQLILAEVLVILQKEFTLTLLISTHSPYFLNAIDTYSFKYEVNKNCNYYVTHFEGNQSKIIDMSDDVDKLYDELALPFENLELERGRLYNARK